MFDEHQLSFILVTGGDTDQVFGQVAVYQLNGLLVAYKERFDKDNFIKNLLLDNLLLVDIYNRARKLHISPETKRVVFILETPPEREQATVENLRNQLETHQGDFITAIDEKNIILVRELEEDDGYEEADTFARSVLKALGLENDEMTHIAYGTIVQ